MRSKNVLRLIAYLNPTETSFCTLLVLALASYFIFVVVTLEIFAYIRSNIAHTMFYSGSVSLNLLELLAVSVACEAALVLIAYLIGGWRGEAFRSNPEKRVAVLRMLEWRRHLCFPLTKINSIYAIVGLLVPIVEVFLVDQVYPEFFYSIQWNPPLELLGLIFLFGLIDTLCIIPLLAYVVFSAKLQDEDLILGQLRLLTMTRSESGIDNYDWFYLIRSIRRCLCNFLERLCSSKTDVLATQLASFFDALSQSDWSPDNESTTTVERIIDVVLSKDAANEVLQAKIESMSDELAVFTRSQRS